MSTSGIKFFWSAFDRVFFIAMGVLGTVATTYITGVLKINPPELIVTQTYNYVDSAPVASVIGGLKIDYKADAVEPYGVLRVDIKNEGRGSADKVRFQIKLPQKIFASYYTEPDFRVYQPTLVNFQDNEFYLEMPNFPSKAADFVVFKIKGDKKLLCGSRIKLVSEDYEGEVEGLRGVECE